MSINVELCIIHILLIMICLESETARPKCGHSEMMKENPSEDSFERKFRKTYRSVNSSGVLCAQRCHDDERCNGISVCPDVCHLFGVFSVTPSSGTYYKNCDVFNINRCENGGEPDEIGYCRCGPGYGGPFCQTVVQDYCYNHWRLMYDTELSQDMDEYLYSARRSCKIKTKVVIDDRIVHSMDNVHTSVTSIWTESSFHLNKSSWNQFDLNATRMFILTKNGKFRSTKTIFDKYLLSKIECVYDTELSQDMDEYLYSARRSCKIKTKVVIDDRIVHSMDNVHTSVTSIWTESSFHLNKSSWNQFDLNATRMFILTKNGKFRSTKVVDMAGSSQSTINSTIVAKWYIKDVTDGSPIFVNNADGSVQAGDINSLLSKIENGSAVTTFFNLFVDKNTKTIVADNLKGLGISWSSPYVSYIPSPTYWFLYKVLTSGTKYVLRWKVGVGSIISPSKQTTKTSWCTDDCWVRAFTSDQFGNGLHGSTSDLARALLSGQQLRVYTGGVAASTRAVYIHGQTISACLEEMMEPIGVAEFDRSGTAVNMIVSSNGQIQTRSYTLDTDSILEESQEYQSIDWFVDTREWTKVLSLSGDGQILNGSITDLRQKVLVGASVRIVVDLSTGHSVVVDADHLEVAPSGHVAADVIYHVNVNFTMNYFAFAATSSAHLWSAIITTEGAYNTYYYTYKRDDGQRAPVSIVDRYIWFVQM